MEGVLNGVINVLALIGVISIGYFVVRWLERKRRHERRRKTASPQNGKVARKRGDPFPYKRQAGQRIVKPGPSSSGDGSQ